MNLNHLYYFRVLAKEEHYTKAANILSITQPSLSHAISNLENELGVTLFEKVGRNARLTKSGQLFLKYVQQSLEMLEEGERIIGEFSGKSGGFLDIGYIYTMGSHFIPENVRAYLKDKNVNNIKFSFGQGTTTRVIEDLKKGVYNIAFASYMEGEPELDFYPVKEEELVLIVPRDHPLSKKSEIDLLETIEYEYIYFTRNSGLRPVIDQLFRDIKRQPNIAYEGEEDSSVAGLVAAGFGIAIIPKIPLLETMEVVSLKINNPQIQRYIYMVTCKKKQFTQIERDFIHFIKENNKIN